MIPVPLRWYRNGLNDVNLSGELAEYSSLLLIVSKRRISKNKKRVVREEGKKGTYECSAVDIRIDVVVEFYMPSQRSYRL